MYQICGYCLLFFTLAIACYDSDPTSRCAMTESWPPYLMTPVLTSPLLLLQLLRKRYIGNDIVTIVFQEPGALPFTPKHIRSQFQHVFIVVRALNPCSENTQYR